MQEVPLYSRPVKVLAIPLFWASSKNALLRANTNHQYNWWLLTYFIDLVKRFME